MSLLLHKHRFDALGSIECYVVIFSDTVRCRGTDDYIVASRFDPVDPDELIISLIDIIYAVEFVDRRYPYPVACIGIVYNIAVSDIYGIDICVLAVRIILCGIDIDKIYLAGVGVGNFFFKDHNVMFSVFDKHVERNKIIILLNYARNGDLKSFVPVVYESNGKKPVIDEF